jgi:hypothetical protein
MAKMGRPKIPDPDWKELERMLQVHNNGEDCAYMLQMSYASLSRKVQEHYGITFDELIKRNQQVGKTTLRKAMMNAVIKGNVSMMIWLSKNWLGMRDNPEEIFEQKPTIIRTKDGVEIKLGFNKDKGKDNDSNKS